MSSLNQQAKKPYVIKIEFLMNATPDEMLKLI